MVVYFELFFCSSRMVLYNDCTTLLFAAKLTHALLFGIMNAVGGMLGFRGTENDHLIISRLMTS